MTVSNNLSLNGSKRTPWRPYISPHKSHRYGLSEVMLVLGKYPETLYR